MCSSSCVGVTHQRYSRVVFVLVELRGQTNDAVQKRFQACEWFVQETLTKKT